MHMDVMHREPDAGRAFDATLTLQRKPLDARKPRARPVALSAA